jgi:hypothetical protein
MAVRVVTDFTNYLDHDLLLPRKEILAATMDNVLDDQQFCLEIEQVTISDVFTDAGHASAGYAEVVRYYVKNRDMCGNGATEATCVWTPLAWCGVAGDDGDIRLTTPHNAVTINIAGAGVDTPSWRGPDTTVQLSIDGSIDEVIIESRLNSGTGPIYVWGVGLFTAS